MTHTEVSQVKPGDKVFYKDQPYEVLALNKSANKLAVRSAIDSSERTVNVRFVLRKAPDRSVGRNVIDIANTIPTEKPTSTEEVIQHKLAIYELEKSRLTTQYKQNISTIEDKIKILREILSEVPRSDRSVATTPSANGVQHTSEFASKTMKYCAEAILRQHGTLHVREIAKLMYRGGYNRSQGPASIKAIQKSLSTILADEQQFKRLHKGVYAIA